MIDEETIKNWIVDEGIFREKKLDDNADFHYIVEFPKDNIMDVVKPREKDFIVIACATQVSPQHLELMNVSSPKERGDFLITENNNLEFKRELTSELDIEKEVVAFLNYKEGGFIYIGIDGRRRYGIGTGLAAVPRPYGRQQINTEEPAS